MRVVDLNRCQGYAQCCYAAPDYSEILFHDPAPEGCPHPAARADAGAEPRALVGAGRRTGSA